MLRNRVGTAAAQPKGKGRRHSVGRSGLDRPPQLSEWWRWIEWEVKRVARALHRSVCPGVRERDENVEGERVAEQVELRTKPVVVLVVVAYDDGTRHEEVVWPPTYTARQVEWLCKWSVAKKDEDVEQNQDVLQREDEGEEDGEEDVLQRGEEEEDGEEDVLQREEEGGEEEEDAEEEDGEEDEGEEDVLQRGEEEEEEEEDAEEDVLQREEEGGEEEEDGEEDVLQREDEGEEDGEEDVLQREEEEEEEEEDAEEDVLQREEEDAEEEEDGEEDVLQRAEEEEEDGEEDVLQRGEEDGEEEEDWDVVATQRVGVELEQQQHDTGVNIYIQLEDEDDGRLHEEEHVANRGAGAGGDVTKGRCTTPPTPEVTAYAHDRKKERESGGESCTRNAVGGCIDWSAAMRRKRPRVGAAAPRTRGNSRSIARRYALPSTHRRSNWSGARVAHYHVRGPVQSQGSVRDGRAVGGGEDRSREVKSRVVRLEGVGSMSPSQDGVTNT